MSGVRHSEIESLLGAYALDAVDADEARAVEEHLATCPSCRDELDAHRRVAAMLGDADGRAPAGVWDRIAAELRLEQAGADASSSIPDTPLRLRPPTADGGPAGAPSAVGASSRRRLPSVAAGVLAAGVAAGLAIVVGILSSRLSSLDHQVGSMQSALAGRSLQSMALAAALDPRDTTVQLTSAPAGERATLIVDRDRSTAYFVPAALPSLPSRRTYQLWSLVRGKPVSLGVLGSHAVTSEVHVQPDMSVFMVTAEPEGGTAQPTGTVLVQGSTSAAS